jgi:hypothetical protein
VNGRLNVNETIQLDEKTAPEFLKALRRPLPPLLDRNTKTMETIASLSLDLDNKWSYLKTHGDPGWESFPSYLDILVPRVLDFFKARHLTITFFIVG